MDAQDSTQQVSLLDVVDATVAKLLDVPGDDQAAKFRLLDDLADAAGLWEPFPVHRGAGKTNMAGQLAAEIDQPSAHAETLSRVAQAVTEAGSGWISVADGITDGETAAATVVADGAGTCLLVCIPVPASMTARSQVRQVRVQVDTVIAVNLGELAP